MDASAYRPSKHCHIQRKSREYRKIRREGGDLVAYAASPKRVPAVIMVPRSREESTDQLGMVVKQDANCDTAHSTSVQTGPHKIEAVSPAVYCMRGPRKGGQPYSLRHRGSEQRHVARTRLRHGPARPMLLL